MKIEDGILKLICDAYGKPEKVDFSWVMDNETVTEEQMDKGTRSVLQLSPNSSFGIYYCIPENTVGVSDKPCEYNVTGEYILHHLGVTIFKK